MRNLAKDQLAIEDVLSSIRRLVAEDQSAGRGSNTNGHRQGKTARGSEASAPKLVLTDAQRVADAHAAGGTAPLGSDATEFVDAPEAPSRPTHLDPEQSGEAQTWSPGDRLLDYDAPPVSDTPDLEMMPGEPTSPVQLNETDAPPAEDALAEFNEPTRPDAAIAELDALIGATEERAEEAPTLDDRAGAMPTHDEQSAHRPRIVFEASSEDNFEAETGDANWPDPDADQALRVLADVRAETAPPSNADLSQSNEADADAFWAAAAALTAAEEDARQTESDDAGDEGGPEEGIRDALPRPSHPLTAPRFSRRRRTWDSFTDITGKDAAEQIAQPPMEAATPPNTAETDSGVTTSPQTGETTDADMGEAAQDMADEVAEGASHSPTSDTSAVDAPETDSPDASTDDVSDLSDLDGLALDEDTLRDLIAEIVRDELKGALGQRITRNVRKMVRREIRLALAAEELD